MASLKFVGILTLTLWVKLSLVSAFVAPSEENSDLVTHLDKIAEHVNNAGATWTAGRNAIFEGKTKEDLKGLVSDSDPLSDSYEDLDSSQCSETESEKLGDDSFDGREKWKNCPSITHITNQGACKSSWAVAAAAVIADRQCIASNGKMKDLMSAQHLLSCCSQCGYGYNGGWSRKAFIYYQKHGVPTGGDYDSQQGCQPYLKEPSSIFISDDEDMETPKCSQECTNKQYGKSLKKDLHFGSGVKTMCCCGIKSALSEDGPVASSMVVYEDFLTYKSGIYRHIWGKKIGFQSVRLLGWGTENGVDYWIAANSWGTGWGEGGFFKIFRQKMMMAKKGLGEAEIDYGFVAPIVKNKKH